MRTEPARHNSKMVIPISVTTAPADERKSKVVYWNNMPTPYIVDRFNALARRDRIDFEAWFSQRREPDRSWDVVEASWTFSYRYLPSLSVRGKALPVPGAVLKRPAPEVIVSLYAHPSFIAGFNIARLRGIRTMFWVEPTFDAWMKRRTWKEALKRSLFSRVDGIVTTGPDGRRFCMRYGAPEERIFFLPYFNQFEHFHSGCLRAAVERPRLRADLGLKGVTFICVGRLWKGKGLAYLLDAFRHLTDSSADNVSLLLVGDGEQGIHLRERCRREQIGNVVFTGFKQRNELPRYYAAADIFVFPTLGDPYGLVLDEAMACGLPVITTSAVGEVRERVDDGINGLVVPPADSNVLFDRMKLLAQDKELRNRLGRAAALKVIGKTPERWAQDFEDAVQQVQSMPRVR